MSRKSNLTSPKAVEIIIIPDAEKVNEAAKLLAPGYKRALLKSLKPTVVSRQQLEIPPR